MITKEQAMDYEAGKTSLIMSFIYKTFPQYFVWICNRRYKRYLEYSNGLNELKITEIELWEKFKKGMQ